MDNFIRLHLLQKVRFGLFNLGDIYFESLTITIVKLVPLLEDYW